MTGNGFGRIFRLTTFGESHGAGIGGVLEGCPPGLELDEAARYGRSGRGKRSDNEIGYHSIRSGDISSSHTVIFGMMGERLEITHHAYNWTCFARGDCDCAKFLEGRGPGLYGVSDVIKL